ncbi:hypothetical protein JRO89_XS09G0201300 [Xanthoceras sorbifolium]|uniref:Uncharacterized protein n=1 Tax=Xanthoceras sorbifolium TaxID=99658 RepID=A0ABQ8HM49_9ROSI|nr:hypothetical protein JRO89_XS09G0201300 [Xanthoceras sorbifolium]
MHRRGRPRIRRVAAERSALEGERVDESVNAPTHETPPEPAQPAVPEGGNLNTAKMAEVLAAALQRPREQNVSIVRAHKLGAKSYDGTGDLERAFSWLETNEKNCQIMKSKRRTGLREVWQLFLDRNSRNEVGQAAPREDLVRQQRQKVSFHGPIARDRAQGRSIVRLSLSCQQVSEALEIAGGASQYAINVESLTKEGARRVIHCAIDVGRKAISSEAALMWGPAVNQKTDIKHQGILTEVEDSREVEPSPEDPVAPVSPVGVLVGVGHPEDSPVDHMLKPVYLQSPSRRLMLPQRSSQVLLQLLTSMLMY